MDNEFYEEGADGGFRRDVPVLEGHPKGYDDGDYRDYGWLRKNTVPLCILAGIVLWMIAVEILERTGVLTDVQAMVAWLPLFPAVYFAWYFLILKKKR